MPKQRMRQINTQLRDYFATAIMRLIEFPQGVVVSVTKVHTTADLHYCTVYVSVVPDSQSGSTLQLIKRHLVDLVDDVAARITFRSVPHFRFVLDDTERKAVPIEQLLDSLLETQ
ncbi:MAG: ribosome-binding factor A [Patescibacteria group bacterium]|jgi:ribosome-binding factor A